MQAQDWYVLWAIVRKEWRIFSRYPLNALLRIADPLIWLTPVYFMSLSFSVNGRAPGL